MPPRPRDPEGRFRNFIDRAFSELEKLSRDDALFLLGMVDGRVSHAKRRLSTVDPDLEDEAPPTECSLCDVPFGELARGKRCISDGCPSQHLWGEDVAGAEKSAGGSAYHLEGAESSGEVEHDPELAKRENAEPPE